MTPEILGIILILTMLFAIFIGFPISFTLIFLGVVFGYLGFGDLVFYLMTFSFLAVCLNKPWQQSHYLPLWEYSWRRLT